MLGGPWWLERLLDELTWWPALPRPAPPLLVLRMECLRSLSAEAVVCRMLGWGAGVA